MAGKDFQGDAKSRTGGLGHFPEDSSSDKSLDRPSSSSV